MVYKHSGFPLHDANVGLVFPGLKQGICDINLIILSLSNSESVRVCLASWCETSKRVLVFRLQAAA